MEEQPEIRRKKEGFESRPCHAVSVAPERKFEHSMGPPVAEIRGHWTGRASREARWAVNPLFSY